MADATPSSFDRFGNPTDLFGQISAFVRSSQVAPAVETRTDYCDAATIQGNGETVEERVAGTLPSWPVGLLVQALIAGGLLWWGWARTRTPARRLPPGTRIA